MPLARTALSSGRDHDDVADLCVVERLHAEPVARYDATPMLGVPDSEAELTQQSLG